MDSLGNVFVSNAGRVRVQMPTQSPCIREGSCLFANGTPDLYLSGALGQIAFEARQSGARHPSGPFFVSLRDQ